jgi:hypothetical protein
MNPRITQDRLFVICHLQFVITIRLKAEWLSPDFSQRPTGTIDRVVVWYR